MCWKIQIFCSLPKTTDCHSMLNESKSETTNEAASQGVKRNFSPVPSHSSKGIEDEMESKRRKKIGELIHFYLYCVGIIHMLNLKCNVSLKVYIW